MLVALFYISIHIFRVELLLTFNHVCNPFAAFIFHLSLTGKIWSSLIWWIVITFFPLSMWFYWNCPTVFAFRHIYIIIDNLLFYIVQPYDFLSLIPVIEGAGGVITDWKGDQLYWEASSKARATSTIRLELNYYSFKWNRFYNHVSKVFNSPYHVLDQI